MSFLFLIDLIELFVQNNHTNNITGDYNLWISKINNSNVLKDGGDELGIFSYKEKGQSQTNKNINL